MFGLKCFRERCLCTVAFSIALFSSTVLGSSVDDVSLTGEELAQNIVAWVRRHGGFFNEKLSFRRINLSDQSSPLGVFADEGIDPEERLMEIPTNCYMLLPDELRKNELQIPEDASKEEEEALSQQNDPIFYHNICHLAHTLIKEMKLGTQSNFLPYITYLEKTQKPGQIPAGWSKAGRDVLQKVATAEGDLVDWIVRNYKGKECIDPDDPLQRYALELVKQRAYDQSFIPLFDMLNHDNGRINTAHDGFFAKQGIKVRASKKILAGEEVYASYDMNGENDYWGTPEILRDFGFVERYPQRWVFKDPDIWFELHEKKRGDGTTTGLQVHWYPAPDGHINEYDKREINFLIKELKRLHNVKRKYLQGNEGGLIPSHEWYTILQFHEAATTAMAYVIEAAVNNAGVNTTSLKTY